MTLGDTTYRGESPPKKQVRILFWREVERRLTTKFRSSRHLVVLSKYAGDVSVLIAMGVPPRNVYGVDVDKHAVAAAQRRYPGVRVAHAQFQDAFAVFPELSDTLLGCAFIDLCCPISYPTLQAVLRLGLHSKLVGFEFQCGREIGAVNKSLLTVGKDPAAARLRLVQQEQVAGRFFSPIQNWSYASHSASHYGKRMVVGLGALKKKMSQQLPITCVDTTWRDVRNAILTNNGTSELWNVRNSAAEAWKAHEGR